MKKFIICIFILIRVVTNDVWSQDVHFAQTEYAPMLLNPALTGAFSHMQVIANYRNQWNSVASPYQTIAASFDARLQRRDADNNSFVALGVNFFNDVAGDMKVTTNQFNLDLAYHIKMGRYSVLRIGIYGGMNQRILDPSRGNWASQFDGDAINTSIGSGENFGSYNHLFMDAGAGIVYTFRRMKYSVNNNVNNNVNCGLAVYHANQPASSFVSLPEDKLAMRISGFINSSFNIRNTPLAVQPAVYVQLQSKYSEVLFGTYLRYNLRESSHFTGSIKPVAAALGIFSRYKDAFVAKGYFQYHQFSVGMAYDFNLSRLTPVSKSRGGVEIFLRFNLDDRLNNPSLW
ncbi:PorP/SprF family type IX secretion system membrane protein [uncultured Fluviicola sp.]|uniref:PorP/SprF family type IX secretion system membrane protein n=1 Tax=uncultured Fluviicola sp. TaxID=463303 RepID=UPI0025EC795A|nr:PorP/SprF family type IX secretion system membrane protein [uncultured Fluviicola sp.]